MTGLSIKKKKTDHRSGRIYARKVVVLHRWVCFADRFSLISRDLALSLRDHARSRRDSA